MEGFLNVLRQLANPTVGGFPDLFPNQKPAYDSEKAKERNSQNIYENFGIGWPVGKNAIIDTRFHDEKVYPSISPVAPLNVGRGTDAAKQGSRYVTDPLPERIDMRFRKLDGTKFNIDSYLNEYERVRNSVMNAKDRDSVIDALEKASRSWPMNIYTVLGDDGLYYPIGNDLKAMADDVRSRSEFQEDNEEYVGFDEMKKLVANGVMYWMVPRAFYSWHDKKPN